MSWLIKIRRANIFQARQKIICPLLTQKLTKVYRKLDGSHSYMNLILVQYLMVTLKMCGGKKK